MVVRGKLSPRGREIDAAQSGSGRALNLAERGLHVPDRDVSQAEESVRIRACPVSEPPVVHPDTCCTELASALIGRNVLARRGGEVATEEWNRLEVVAAVKDELCCDSVSV